MQQWLKSVWRWVKNLFRSIFDKLLIWIRKKRQSIVAFIRKVLAIRPRHVARFIKNTSSAVYSYIKDTPPKEMVLDGYDYLIYLLKRIKHWVRRNWFNRFVSGLVLLVLVLFLFFHFHLASIGRIQKIVVSNYHQSKLVLDELVDLQLDIDNLEQNDTSLSYLLGEIKSAYFEIETFSPKDFRNIYTDYAFRNLTEGNIEANKINKARTLLNKNEILSDINAHFTLLETVKSIIVYEDVQNNIDNYIDNLEAVINLVSGLSESNQLIDTKQTLRNLRVLEAEAQEYKLINDFDRFESRRQDFNGELFTEVRLQLEFLVDYYSDIASGQVSNYERAASFIYNNVN